MTGCDQSDQNDDRKLDQDGNADRPAEDADPGPRGHAGDSRDFHGREDNGENDADRDDVHVVHIITGA